MAEYDRWGCRAITAPPLSKSCKSPTTEEADSQSVSPTPLSPAEGCVKLGKRGTLQISLSFSAFCSFPFVLPVATLLCGGLTAILRQIEVGVVAGANCHFWHFSCILPNEEIKGKLSNFGRQQEGKRRIQTLPSLGHF